METFCALLAICAGNSPVPGEFPAQRPVTRSFDVFFDLRLNKRLSKQPWGWWFETLSRPLWRHCNAFKIIQRQTLKARAELKGPIECKGQKLMSPYDMKTLVRVFSIRTIDRKWKQISFSVIRKIFGYIKPYKPYLCAFMQYILGDLFCFSKIIHTSWNDLPTIFGDTSLTLA